MKPDEEGLRKRVSRDFNGYSKPVPELDFRRVGASVQVKVGDGPYSCLIVTYDPGDWGFPYSPEGKRKMQELIRGVLSPD
jgi:hypothetical protein